MKKIIRCATIGLSLNIFCKGILQDLKQQGYEVVALSSPDADLMELGEREQVRTVGVEMDRHINPLKDLKSLWRLYKVFRRERPDMIHSMTPKAGLLCMMAGWMARVPVRIHTFTGLVWPTSLGMKRRILMLTDRLTCACATHVIPEGQSVLNDLTTYGITRKPMHVLGYGNVCGVDLNYWKREQTSLDMGKNCYTFLFVGRIVGDKGVNELVMAFANLLGSERLSNSAIKKCRLQLVGWIEDKLDPVMPETRRMMDEIAEIELLGPKYGKELKACYEAADCFVFPSYREGFPNTVLEAGAMELPSIVTDINGSRDIVTTSDGEKLKMNASTVRMEDRLKPGERMSIRENGVMVPSKDVDALCNAMLWMMEQPEESRKIGQCSRQIVAERYEQGFVRNCLYAFYEGMF